MNLLNSTLNYNCNNINKAACTLNLFIYYFTYAIFFFYRIRFVLVIDNIDLSMRSAESTYVFSVNIHYFLLLFWVPDLSSVYYSTRREKWKYFKFSNFTWAKIKFITIAFTFSRMLFHCATMVAIIFFQLRCIPHSTR